jgi:putative ABC transport system permease protein
MRRSLRSWLWRVPLDQEVDEEIAFHIEMRTRELIEQGIDPRVAREMALARAGDLGRLKRTCMDLGRTREREMRLTRWLEELRDDVKCAFRQMKGSPAFTCVAALTLALGIGANSAIFALADAALLRPLPYPEPDRLVALWEAEDGRTRDGVNPLEFVDWSERNRTFDSMAAYLRAARAMTGPDGMAELIPSQAVTPQFFDVLRVRPILGRTFRRADVHARAVVVLREDLWRGRFNSDPALIGRAIRLEGELMTVIGVVPDRFRFDRALDDMVPRLWTVLDVPPGRDPANRYAHYFNVIGRLRPGVTLEAARADLTTVAETIARESPATNHGHGVAIEPLREMLFGSELRFTSLLLLGVVGFVLLMCCANVANLVLTRASARTRELAVRAALGAGRGRVVRQLLTESLVLGALGAVLGAGIGLAILQVAPTLVPPGLLPTTVPLSFDARVAAFCVTTTLTVAIGFGLLPARQATSRSLAQAVGAGAQASASGNSSVRTLIATTEVAIAVLLLCGAGLLLRTLLILGHVDPGHEARDVLTLIVGPGMTGDQDAMRRFYDAVEREVRSVPGVQSAGWGSALPFAGMWYGQSFQIEGDPPRPQADRESAGYQMVSATYFRTLGIPILAGRDFTESDRAGNVQVCIVNEAFVRRYLSGRSPLETRLAVNAMAQPPQVILREIVGVVRQVKERPGEPEDRPHIYVPIAQNSWWSASLVVQADRAPATALAPAVRAAVARVNPDRAVAAVRTLDDIEREATATPRFRAALVGTFAGLALMLAAVGVFGVLACSVQQRRREFGVRMALGASTGVVLRLVTRSAMGIVAVGAAIGLVAAAALGQTISTFLFGVEPRDPVTYTAVALLVAVTAAAATAAPALRATRVDPAVALRAE